MTSMFLPVSTGCGFLSRRYSLPSCGAAIWAVAYNGRVAKRNAARHGVADRITFVETSFLDGLDTGAHLIVSNPPYVPALSKPALSPEVRDYEPCVAVYGGDDGLEGLRRVVEDAAALLAPGGWLIVEFGYGQEDAVVTLVNASPVLSLVKVRSDLQDIPRTVVAQRRS